MPVARPEERRGTSPCYLLPLRWQDGQHNPGELTSYLRQLARTCDVLIVDGSADLAFARHNRAWHGVGHHIRPDPRLGYANGKAAAVITGMRAATSDRVIIADDDVRYDQQALRQVLALLENADLVIPQNYFDPLPWHAAWDSARSLINRALGTDYPGTLAIRRHAFLSAGCYDGNVMFENLELMRTLRAGGARVIFAPDVMIRRLPPGTRHFLGQRVRQAYDSLAQPPRLAAELAVLPLAVLAVLTRRTGVLGCACAAVIALAETGRRRHGGTAVFPWPVPLLAPAWLAERSVCSWLAVAYRLRGGIPYNGRQILRAANSSTALRGRARPSAAEPRHAAGPN